MHTRRLIFLWAITLLTALVATDPFGTGFFEGAISGLGNVALVMYYFLVPVFCVVPSVIGYCVWRRVDEVSTSVLAIGLILSVACLMLGISFIRAQVGISFI